PGRRPIAWAEARPGRVAAAAVAIGPSFAVTVAAPLPARPLCEDPALALAVAGAADDAPRPDAPAAASPATSTTASTVPTGTVSPAWTRIFVSVPVLGAGISIETLSVSTSRRISSASTRSPTCLCQVETVPSVTVSPSCGINTSIERYHPDIVVSISRCREPGSSRQLRRPRAPLHPRARSVHELPDPRDDPVRVRDLRIFHVVRRSERDVRRRDAHDRAVEIPEQLLGDDRRDLRAPAAEPRVVLDGHETPRARDLAQNRLRIERHERADVHHCRGNAVLLLENLRSLQRTRHHQRERADRDVVAALQHVRLAERH